MKLQPGTKREFRRICIGVLAGCVLMVIVFALIGKFSLSVALGALLGGGIAVGNFYYLCISVQRAADAEDPAVAKRIMQASYSRRMLIVAVGIILGAAVKWLQVAAVAIPLLMPRATILVMQVTGVYKPEKAPQSEAAEEE